MVRAMHVGNRIVATGLLLLSAFAAQAQTTVSNAATVAPPSGGVILNSGTSCTPASAPAGTTVSFDSATNGGTCTAKDTDTVLVAPTVAKAFAPSTITAGGTSVLTITLNNNNATAATLSAALVDTLPAGVTLANATFGGTCTGTVSGATGGSTVTYVSGATIPGGAPGSCTITANVTSSTPGTVTNTIAAGALQTSNGNNAAAATANLTVQTAANVSLTKAGPLTALAGSSFQYTLTLTNSGQTATGTNLVVQDQLPAGVVATAVAGASCGAMPSAAGALLTCAVPGPVAANSGTQSFTVTVTAPATSGNITNYASTNPTGAGNPGTSPGKGCVSNASTSCANAATMINAPKLDITKGAPTSATVGQSFNYTITVKNIGTADTTAAATVTDTIPTGLTINSASAGCTIAAQLVTCSVPTGLSFVTPGNTTTFTVNVTSQVSIAGALVSNVAHVQGGGDPNCSVNCDSPPVTTQINAPKLNITKGAPTSATVGQSFNYVIMVQNIGTADTTAAATVTDTIQTGLTINSASAGCTIAAQLVTCTVPAGLSYVSPGNTTAFTVSVTPQASTSGTLVNNMAHVKGGGDPTCAVNCDSPNVPTQINAPKLDITKTAPATAVVGVPYDYVITVKNSGTAATTSAMTV
ncbi:MAG: DUF11 domain-containing protein, partial [Proteobacteria bacterium]|nr:DUF11 domain-containing protein [Pseudomonadota bacterium]